MAIPPHAEYLACLINSLAGTLPPEFPADARLRMAAAALEAFQPRDIVETLLAVRLIAAVHAANDSYTRAMQPNLTDTERTRLRANGVAVSRSADAAQRTLDKRRPAGSTPDQVRGQGQPAATPANDAQPMFGPNAPPMCNPNYTPRDKYGAPIKFWRWMDMTAAQRRAAYGEPEDFALQDAARAQEDIAIEAERQHPTTEPQAEPPDQAASAP